MASEQSTIRGVALCCKKPGDPWYKTTGTFAVVFECDRASLERNRKRLGTEWQQALPATARAAAVSLRVAVLLKTRVSGVLHCVRGCVVLLSWTEQP